MAKAPVRIANFSGALGDYIGAFAAAVRGEPVDVLIGDYLAEITMARVTAGFCTGAAPASPAAYYVDVFLRQLRPELEAIAERGLKIVTNAGAFNPAGLAAAIRAEIAARGLALTVAHVEGDDMMPRFAERAGQGAFAHLDSGRPIGDLAGRIVAANAYMGGWGIAAALGAGADIVICGRVSDASLVLGPAAWWHGWQPDAWDVLAGGVAAGHIIECGPQAMGGNFSGFTALAPATRLGFPIAEIAADGSTVITKRAAEGGAVTVDTVKAQLMYEIQGPDYLNPDVVLHIDSIEVTQEGPDRVRLSGVRGSPAPETTKVGCFYPNGWRTTIWGFATGIDVQRKIDWLDLQLRSIVDTLALDDYRFEPLGQPVPDPASEAEATVAIRIAAAAQKKSDLGKLLGGYASFGLGGMPGYHGDPVGPPEPRIEYWPGLVRQGEIRQQVVLDDGRTIAVAPPPTAPFRPRTIAAAATEDAAPALSGTTRAASLGDVVFARSGDKGGNANLGVWCRDPAAWDWLRGWLDAETLGKLLGLRQDVIVERYELANVRGLMFVLKGYFGESGSGNIGLDQIGKAIGEFLRARQADIPVELLPDAA